MTQQPEALRHAEWLELSLAIGAQEAADELRRLHEFEVAYGVMMKQAESRIAEQAQRVNTLETALGQAMEALEWLTAAEPGDEPPINEAITTAKQALGKPDAA